MEKLEPIQQELTKEDFEKMTVPVNVEALVKELDDLRRQLRRYMFNESMAQNKLEHLESLCFSMLHSGKVNAEEIVNFEIEYSFDEFIPELLDMIQQKGFYRHYDCNQVLDSLESWAREHKEKLFFKRLHDANTWPVQPEEDEEEDEIDD